MCFSTIEQEQSEEALTFELRKMPYKLLFKNVSGYWEDCIYCGVSRCPGCPVPYSNYSI